MTRVLGVGMTLGLGVAAGCAKHGATVNQTETAGVVASDPAAGGGDATTPNTLKVEEKKALRASQDKVQAAAARLAAAGVPTEVTLDVAPVERYDLAALGRSKAEVLGALGNVPDRILDAMALIAADADYREAFGKVTRIAFVPSDRPRGEDFDYDTSATLEDSTLTIVYAPLTHMHGGYERSIKNCF